ncbi:MAG: tetratricopeptide repeat protein, partial [Nitrospirae bacterium]|nr:tetratricopeptide repeat protein [Nitrospirota bacterium]
NSGEALAFYESALQTARKMGGNTGKEGHALRGMGIIHEQQGNIDPAAACFTESAALLSESGDIPSWAEVCRRLGDLMSRDFCQRDKALHYYGAALAYYRKEGPVDAVRPLLNRMGYSCWENGKPEEAIPFYLESLHLAEEGGALAAISVVYRETGKLEASLETGLRALAAARSLHDTQAERYVLSSLCDTYLAMERYPEAEKAGRTALKLCSHPDSGDPDGGAWTHYRLAKILRKKGTKAESRVHFDKALSLAEKSGDQVLLDQIALQQKGERCPSSSLPEPSGN